MATTLIQNILINSSSTAYPVDLPIGYHTLRARAAFDFRIANKDVALTDSNQHNYVTVKSGDEKIVAGGHRIYLSPTAAATGNDNVIEILGIC